MLNSLKIAVIGCGDIAGGYDEVKKSDGIFSHAGAYKSLKNTLIEAAFDINNNRLKDFCAYWSVNKACNSLDEILSGSYDIISVCTPDDSHEIILEKIISRGCTRYIWAEKPLTTTVGGAEKILKLAKDKKIGILLSNQRRWEPDHIMAKQKIEKEIIGEVIHATGYYVKGVSHIGCTLIDTLRFLCGEVAWVVSIPPFDSGSYNADYSLHGLLGFRNGATASIVGCDKREYIYSLFEIDIIGSHGRIKIEKNGDLISYFIAGEYSHYPGFRELQLSEEVNTKMKWAMKYGAELILKDLSEGNFSTYFAEEGLKDLYIVDSLKRSAMLGGAKIEI